MKKILILILTFCIVLVSAYAEVTTNDSHTWEKEDGKAIVCAGENNYIEFNNPNEACTFRYGDKVISSVRNSEYKTVSGCGLPSGVSARLYLCIYPGTFNAPLVTIDEPYVWQKIWQKKDGNFVYCDGNISPDFSDGFGACRTKYNRSSAWSLCNPYKINQEIGCGVLAEARMCQCIFPGGVEEPAKVDFSVSDIIVPSTPNETPSTPPSGGGGGGGGGGHGTTTTISGESRTSLEVDIVNGVSRYLDLNNKGTFEFKGEKHTIYVKQIKEDSIVIVFESNPIEIELKTGETKQIDINADGKNDLNVKLVNIYNGMAEVLVKEIKENIEKKVEVKEEAKTEDKKGMENISGAAVSRFNMKDYAIGATLILIAAIFVVLVVRLLRRVV